MSYWSFVKAESATNLDDNPSAEKATTGWVAGAGTLARDATYQAVGVYSFKYTPTATTSDGLYRSYTLAISTQYTWSISFRGVNGVSYQIRVRNETAGTDVTTLTITGTGTWKRHVITFTTTGAGTAYRLFVEKVGSASTGAYYIDAVQLEAKAYATTYCDGDQPGCSWTGVAHASTSTRSAQSGAGGLVVDFDDSTLAGFRINQNVGTGMPPIEIVDSLPALGDGADFQRAIFRPREFQFVGQVQGQGGVDNTANRIDYHARRLRLAQALHSRRLATEQPVPIRYTVDGKSVEIDSIFQGGLEKGNLESPVLEEVTLRFKAEDPFWRKVMGMANGDDGGQQGGAVLGVQQSFADVQTIMRRDATGAWSSLGPPNAAGTYDDVKVIIEDDTYIYVGGNFSNWDNIVNADGIVRYNKQTGVWSALGTGLNDYAKSLAIGPDGSLYAGGNFTTAGGGAAARIAKWNGATWSALGSGMDSGVWALAIGPDGSLYAGGGFTTAGGGAAAGVAKWNGATWSALGAGVNNTVYALAIGPDGSLYAGGNFTAAGGITLSDRAAKWDGGIWIPLLDIDLPGSPNVSSISFYDNALALGFNTSGTATSSTLVTVSNTGSFDAYPTFTLTGPGALYNLVNWTTGKAIYFNDFTLLTGEVVTLTIFPQGATFISSFRGNIADAILEGSDETEFVLKPGANVLSLLIGDATATATVLWDILHLSFDGVAV